jgi:hypothetical protein
MRLQMYQETANTGITTYEDREGASGDATGYGLIGTMIVPQRRLLRRTGGGGMISLLRALVPLHEHRKPRKPNAHDHGDNPLLPRHAGELIQHCVNPAHGTSQGVHSRHGIIKLQGGAVWKNCPCMEGSVTRGSDHKSKRD